MMVIITVLGHLHVAWTVDLHCIREDHHVHFVYITPLRSSQRKVFVTGERHRRILSCHSVKRLSQLLAMFGVSDK